MKEVRRPGGTAHPETSHSLNLSHHKRLLSANHMPGAQDEQTEDKPRTSGETQGNAQTGPFDPRSPTGPAAPLGHKNANK